MPYWYIVYVRHLSVYATPSAFLDFARLQMFMLESEIVKRSKVPRHQSCVLSYMDRRHRTGRNGEFGQAVSDEQQWSFAKGQRHQSV